MEKARREFALLLRLIGEDRPVKSLARVFFAVIAAVVLSTACVAVLIALAHGRGADVELLRGIRGSIGLFSERGFGSMFSYGLSFLASVLLLLTGFERRSRVLLLSALLMAFVWYDDWAQYHEKFGRFLRENFEFPGVLATNTSSTSEILAWMIPGIFFLCVGGWSLRRPRPGDRGILAAILLPFLLLVFCAAVIDYFHHLTHGAQTGFIGVLDGVIGIIEDGGEMVAVALIALVAVGLQRNAAQYFAACEAEG